MTYSQVKWESALLSLFAKSQQNSEDFVRNTGRVGQLKEHIKNDDFFQKVLGHALPGYDNRQDIADILGLKGYYSFYLEPNLENLLQILSSASL